MASLRLPSSVVYFFSFLLGRGALFFSPIILANFLPRFDYGTLETAHATASLVSTVATFGTVGLIPLVLLGHAQKISFGNIIAHHLAVAFGCLAVGVFSWFLGVDRIIWLVALLMGTTVLQTLGSTHLKTLGRGEASVLLDSGLFGIMALAVVAVYVLGSGEAIISIVVAVFLYFIVLAYVYFRLLFLDRHSYTFFQWKLTLHVGFPLMLGGLISLLATTSGRLGMGILGGPTLTADYSVLARASALPIVAHQLVLVARFRNLFTLPHADVQRAAAEIVFLVAISAFAFCLLAPYLGQLLGSTFARTWSVYPLPGAWVASQSVLWSGIALNDLIISRHHVMARVIPISGGFIFLALFVGAVVFDYIEVGIQNFVYIHAFVMFLFYVVQAAAMAFNGVMVWRVWLTTVVAYLALVLFFTLLMWF